MTPYRTPAFLLSSATSLVVAAMLIGCEETSAGQPQPKLPTVTVELEGVAFELEVADEEDEQRTGMMFRTEVGPNEGMLFVYSEEQPMGFYMRNVPIELDIVFIDGEGEVVGVATMKPFDERTTRSPAPAQYAIEMAGGRAAEIDLEAGDTVELPTTWPE